MHAPGSVTDENPIKVDSQILSVHVEPEMSEPITVPVTFTFANDDVSIPVYNAICYVVSNDFQHLSDSMLNKNNLYSHLTTKVNRQFIIFFFQMTRANLPHDCAYWNATV